MSAEPEVSPDDPRGLADAIQRAAYGSTVRLVRDGRPVADIVPVPDQLGAAIEESRPTRDIAIGRAMANRFGAPTLKHYRDVYSQLGRDWPGETYIRAHHPVAEAS